MVLRKAQDRLRSRFRFSVSEIDHQELMQRARIGAVSIGSDRRNLQQISENFIRESERILGPDLVNYTIEILDHD